MRIIQEINAEVIEPAVWHAALILCFIALFMNQLAGESHTYTEKQNTPAMLKTSGGVVQPFLGESNVITVREDHRGVHAGAVFGSWEVLGPPFSIGRGNFSAVCRCACGQIRAVNTGNLARDRSLQCPKCLGLAARQFNRTHGDTTVENKHASRIYRIWAAMKTRCTNPRQPHYQFYGGRGISVCAEWSESFEAFKEWALSNGYSDTLTIDRIDNNKGYGPGNCQWLTSSENTAKRNTDYAQRKREQSGV